jgi:hypothetical protein
LLPSRSAKRCPTSMAMALDSPIDTVRVSPGMTISTPSGNTTAPVTSDLGQQLTHFQLDQILELDIINHVDFVHEYNHVSHSYLAREQNVLTGLGHGTVVIVMPRSRSSGALPISSRVRDSPPCNCAITFVSAAVNVVLPWST